MTACAYLLFPTAIGTCGVAWGAAGILAVQLPEANVGATRERLLRALPLPCGQEGVAEIACAPQWLARAVEGIQALLSGQPRDLREVPLDLSQVGEFARRVYALTRAIAPGCTRTYGELARDLGSAGLARAVGQALGANPFAPVVPCHRVLAAGGRMGGFSAQGGAATKRRMLEMEGAFAHATLELFGAAQRDAALPVEHR